MDFVKLLRNHSGGKPIGMKICIGNKSEFMAICKAMVETKPISILLPLMVAKAELALLHQNIQTM
jgi:hypothetical protein